MGRIEKTVFISYRRKHVPWALAISQILTDLEYDVFFDYKSIGPGDFGQVIIENVKARAHFLVLLAPSSLEGLQDNENWMRKEIELAIESQRNIIPIMLEGFDFGASETRTYFTGSLAILQKYNGLTLSGEYFEAGIQRLCTQFLNVPLSKVSIPVSPRVKKEVLKQQKAIASAEPVNKNTLTAWKWFEQAYQTKEPREKICLYDKAIKLDENFTEAFVNRGNCYNEMKQNERAIKDYSEAIRIDPKEAKAYNNRGNRYAELKQYERAIEDYNEAIRLYQKYAIAYYNRGLSYSYLKKYEHAIADYSEVIRLDPKYTAAYNSRGLNYTNLKQYKRAINDYDEAIRLNPKDVTAYNNRGLNYAYLKQYERAISDYDEAIWLDPDFLTSYYNKACAFALQGKIQTSIQLLRETLARDKEKYCELLNTDTDFDTIRNEPEFQQLIAEFCDC